MTLHRDILTLIRAYTSSYPIPRGAAGEIDDLCRAWTKRLCETVKFHFPDGMPGVGGVWGWKRASTSRPLSKESLALQRGAALDGWDLLIGVGTGTPQLASNPAHHDLVAEGNQIFIPVEATNHLTPAAPSTHAKLSGKLWGMSAFDLFAALDAGDTTYYKQVVRPSGLVPRVVVASIWVGGGSNRRGRKMEQGRDQLRLGLQTLEKDRLTCEVTLLCDTQKYAERDGLTREGALAHITLCNAIMLEHPGTIVGVRIGNENSHSVEAAYMVDPAFLREAASRIDTRFPLAFGAGHGGEPVLVGGSYISHHSDRSKSPEDNAQIMGEAQRHFGVPVVDAEPLGITEPDRVAGRQRTSDPAYAARLATSALQHNLGGATLHLDSGIGCHVEEHGRIHQLAMTQFKAIVGGVVTVPETDPVLDAPLSPADPVGYLFWIHNHKAIEAAAVTWYEKAQGRTPAASDIAHGLWRGLNEGDRWGTLRNAWTETWGPIA